VAPASRGRPAHLETALREAGARNSQFDADAGSLSGAPRSFLRVFENLGASVSYNQHLPYYEKLTPVFGAVMVPPQALMRDVIEDLLTEGRGAAARAAFEQMLAAYGEPSNAEATRRKIAEVERRPPPTETVESLLATPFPSADEAKNLIGEWKGESWLNPEDRHTLTLRIRVVDGRCHRGDHRPSGPWGRDSDGAGVFEGGAG